MFSHRDVTRNLPANKSKKRFETFWPNYLLSIDMGLIGQMTRFSSVSQFWYIGTMFWKT